MEDVKNLLREKNILSHTNQGILVAKVASDQLGLQLAEMILSAMVDTHTLFLLSGGRTPKSLYGSLAVAESMQPAAVGMIDERYGPKWHNASNELMIRETGLLRYFEMRGIPFFPINDGHTREETAEQYDEKLRELFSRYQKIVGILGIGSDGHTAGIPAESIKLNVKNSKLFSKSDLVADYEDDVGTYGERVTMTFLGLSHLDLLMVLVFGDDKKKALDAVFSPGTEEEVPGRFYTRPDIAQKTIFLTDQAL